MNELEQKIRRLQKTHGYEATQNGIDSGLSWKLEGSVGRYAMNCLEEGACFLPEERHTDQYGNMVPARSDVRPNTMGTLERSDAFWTAFVEDEDDADNEGEVFVSHQEIDVFLGIPQRVMEAMEKGTLSTGDVSHLSDDEINGLIDIGETLAMNVQALRDVLSKRKDEI